MSNVLEMQRKAQAIADRATAQTANRATAEAANDVAGLSLAEALTAFNASAAEAQRACTDRRELTLFESQPERVHRLIDLLMQGNYRDTSGAMAGITARSLRSWMEKAEAGNERYHALAELVRIAEAFSESAAVRKVRAAGHDPRFWAAEMTYLERRYPDRWGRRTEETNTPKVIVQIGVSPSDVRVNIQGATPSASAAEPASFLDVDVTQGET
jgi:hypothetical protein